jgi:hypothetical protein
MSVILFLIHLFGVAIVTPSCGSCPAACPVDSNLSRVVRVHIFNQSRLDEAGVAVVVSVANRLWAPYGITIESNTTPGSIVVVVAAGSMAVPAGSSGDDVLGTTMFSDGHATPNIRLWFGTAEEVTRRIEYPSWPPGVGPPATREVSILQVIGVALAHELGHYLLDTSDHSSEGLLRAHLSVPEMEHADPVRLTLTCGQRRAIFAGTASR